jgi:hypothetical protein
MNLVDHYSQPDRIILFPLFFPGIFKDKILAGFSNELMIINIIILLKIKIKYNRKD